MTLIGVTQAPFYFLCSSENDHGLNLARELILTEDLASVSLSFLVYTLGQGCLLHTTVVEVK